MLTQEQGVDPHALCQNFLCFVLLSRPLCFAFLPLSYDMIRDLGIGKRREKRETSGSKSSIA